MVEDRVFPTLRSFRSSSRWQFALIRDNTERKNANIARGNSDFERTGDERKGAVYRNRLFNVRYTDRRPDENRRTNGDLFAHTSASKTTSWCLYPDESVDRLIARASSSRITCRSTEDELVPRASVTRNRKSLLPHRLQLFRFSLSVSRVFVNEDA